MASFADSRSAGFKGGESGTQPALAQFTNSEPEAHLPAVNDKSAGYKALSDAFGDISKASFTVAEKMAEEKSNAMLQQSADTSEKLKTQAEIDMIKDPSNASKIAASTEYTNETIKQAAYVNNEDRRKLNWLVDRGQDSLNLKAAQTEYEQSKRNIANQYWDNYPSAINQATEALNKGDMKTAQIVLDTLHTNAQAAASIGAISPEQLGKIHTTTLQLYDRAKNLHDQLNNPDGMTAEQYHTATMSPFESNSMDNIGQPVDHNTQWMAAHYNNDRSVQGQFNALYTGQPVNVGVIASASNAEYQKFIQTSQGVNAVRGSIAAGTPFNMIQARINALESKPTPLTPAEEGAVNYWKSFNSRLGTDNAFYGVLGQTVLGQQYAAAHTAQAESLKTTKTGLDQATALMKNDNDYIGQNISLAHALHMDYHYIKPIPAEWINEVKSSFQKDAPVLPALQRLEYLNPEYRPYLADAMPRPHQGVAIWVAGLTLGKTDSSFQADLIHANQESVSPLAQMDKKGEVKREAEKSSLITSAKVSVGTKPDNIWNDIVNNNDEMKAIYQYMGKLPGGSTTQDGFRTMAVNYIYDQAQRAGDSTLENKDQYVQKFATNIEKGFNLYRNDKALINLNDIPVSRTQDVDHLTNYVLSEAYKRIHAGKTEAEFQTAIDINPLMVMSTPDRRLVVIDRYGHVAVTPDGHEAFDMPYTSKMLSAAQANTNSSENYLKSYGVINNKSIPILATSPEDVERSMREENPTAKDIISTYNSTKERAEESKRSKGVK